MSITSDLRGFALVCDEQTKKTLLMAADRIDAELAERYVALPVDADGVPTVEDVLREFSLRVTGKEVGSINHDVVAEYAAKLRLAGDGE